MVADLPAFREYLDYGRDVLVVAPGDDQALADQLYRIATEPNLRAALAEAGREVAGRSTWAACARGEHLALYASLSSIG